MTIVRFREHAALTLRLPPYGNGHFFRATRIGKEGLFRGRDCRGEKVLCGLVAILDSDWLILSEIDETEALSAMHPGRKKSS